MRKRFYTLWKSKEGKTDEAILLSKEKFFVTKYGAFKRAQKLLKQLAIGWNYVILVRKITIGNNVCEEWEFQPVQEGVCHDKYL